MAQQSIWKTACHRKSDKPLTHLTEGRLEIFNENKVILIIHLIINFVYVFNHAAKFAAQQEFTRFVISDIIRNETGVKVTPVWHSYPNRTKLKCSNGNCWQSLMFIADGKITMEVFLFSSVSQVCCCVGIVSGFLCTWQTGRLVCVCLPQDVS